jgi:hypothetical protein
VIRIAQVAGAVGALPSGGWKAWLRWIPEKHQVKTRDARIRAASTGAASGPAGRVGRQQTSGRCWGRAVLPRREGSSIGWVRLQLHGCGPLPGWGVFAKMVAEKRRGRETGSPGQGTSQGAVLSPARSGGLYQHPSAGGLRHLHSTASFSVVKGPLVGRAQELPVPINPPSQPADPSMGASPATVPAGWGRGWMG